MLKKRCGYLATALFRFKFLGLRLSAALFRTAGFYLNSFVLEVLHFKSCILVHKAASG
jgi:hypothetical protein